MPGTPVSVTILEALREKGASNPGDIVSATGLPRYLVLASFQLLEELGFIKCIYCKGAHKVYTLTEKGQEYLEQHTPTAEAAEAEEAIA